MDETQEPLVLTVHLLANAGQGALLQQSLDQLLSCVCPELRLFLVSERASPGKSDDKSHSRRSRFPGTSVLLFLRQSLGEEHLSRVLGSLRRWPWQARPCRPSILASQDFYSLDPQLPVWGVRQVRGGAEILRVTLYCSFDNYEDAVRLYEMILQRDATAHKSDFCLFVLHATERWVLQLALKQLPLGVAVDPKESSVLQFRVQEIGQLVPLLPHPCVPISRTRWQTQDYDGNKILLQVQLNTGLGGRNGELSYRHSTSGAHTLPRDSRLTLGSQARTLEPRTRRSRSRRFKVGSLELPEPGRSPGLDNTWDSSWKSSDCSHQPGGPNTSTQLPPPTGPSMKVGSWENSSEKLEAETNVDTGFTVVSSEERRSLLSRFPRERWTGQSPSCSPAALPGTAASKKNRSMKERIRPLSLGGQRDLGATGLTSKCPVQLPVQGPGKEEFFI
ncbi:protein FAM124B [Sorex fumeus]|uniref:protein FAM124B n=1 Tax=Sorex fumeus TaxID=62283 RepID=UPI0024AC9167|nr:protein FAM124B [Sorex fumeus]